MDVPEGTIQLAFEANKVESERFTLVSKEKVLETTSVFVDVSLDGERCNALVDGVGMFEGV